MIDSPLIPYLFGDARGLVLVTVITMIFVYLALRKVKKRKRSKSSVNSDIETLVMELSGVHEQDLPDFKTTKEFEAWQGARRQEFIDRMLYQHPGLVEFVEKDSLVKDGFVQQTIEVIYQKKPLFRYFRLLPNDTSAHASNKLPVILAFMGHGSVKDVIDDANSYQHGFAADFAREGYLVYVMENIGMESKRDFHLALDQALRLEGQSWYSMLFAHQRIVLDRIFSDSAVDTSRVGAAGVSTGGLLALSAAVQEPRIAATCVQGFFGRMRNSFIKDRRQHCHCGAIVGILPDFDLPILTLLVAPRYTLIANGVHDSFPPDEAKQALALVQPIMQKFSLHEPELVVHPGGHEFDTPSAMTFFEKRLKQQGN